MLYSIGYRGKLRLFLGAEPPPNHEHEAEYKSGGNGVRQGKLLALEADKWKGRLELDRETVFWISHERAYTRNSHRSWRESKNRGVFPTLRSCLLAHTLSKSASRYGAVCLLSNLYKK